MELKAGLYRYKGKIYSVFSQEKWKNIPEDIRKGFEEDFQERIDNGLKVESRKVSAKITTVRKKEKTEDGKIKYRYEKKKNYFFSNGQKATESNYKRFVFSQSIETGTIPEDAIAEFQTVNNGILSAMELAFEEGKTVEIIEGNEKKIITALNFEDFRETLRTRIKEIRESVKKKKKTSSLFIVGKVQEFNNIVRIEIVELNVSKKTKNEKGNKGNRV